VLKKILILIFILIYYNFIFFTHVKIDTINKVIIKIFLQLVNRAWYLINYFFKIISSTEYNYNIYNKKLLVIIYTLKK
ncbi:hypothetical protein BO78DRAFT_302875, partial [Aspergillus sclerotiicarbonarius CBS 121057]